MNMTYNGVELPASPVREGYPFGAIYANSEGRHLVLFSEPNPLGETYYSGETHLTFDGAGIGWVQFYLVEGEWEEHSSGYDVFSPIVNLLIWANYDVLGPDGNVYLAASDPLEIFAATHTIHADLLQRGVRPRIDAMQGDSMTRRIEFVLTAGGVPWTPPEGTSAALSYIRPDGVGRVYDKLPDGTEAYTISGNIIRMTLLPEVLQVAGDVMAVLQIIRKADGKLISTFPVEVAVEAEPSYNLHRECTSWEPVSVTAVKGGSEITVTAAYASGKTETSVITLDDAGNPVSVIKNDITIALHWEGFA